MEPVAFVMKKIAKNFLWVIATIQEYEVRLFINQKKL